ncbi:YifB family Mg chelatase-like AAA ATPase [Aeromicrobium sp. Leaf350]|uniref:YifB family Mg chelatase-like AAA ATPase n=1 Tax=Aeromicrobium sp. Leaf350 TaxID=2876565 RepID=UPI001E30BA6D|nr:YifB family Mg chelatase-like AAA ATPase [Aeromicrobium sp. Leaf350]
MSGRAISVTLDGLTGRPIEVEADIVGGLPRTVIVGLPDATVNEARDRCKSAVMNSGVPWPDQRITVNLAPSTLPKTGSHYDLPIAIAVLAAQRAVPADELVGTAFVGELALDGRLRAVPGVLPATLAAAEAGCTHIVVPEVNVPEAELVEGIVVTGVRSLRQLVAMMTGDEVPDDPPVPPIDPPSAQPWGSIERLTGLDLADVAGHEDVRLAVLVAAVGGHHLSMVGPPGVGKTMLAQRLPGLLPDLERSDAIEVSAVHSVAGLLPSDVPLLVRPPFLDPHHTASAAAIVGGGSRLVRPGAMSLAHRGVLFLDEAPEFAINVLEALRQPLESGRIVVARAAQTIVYPARFQLVIAANPCPCGQGATRGSTCRCSPAMRRRYGEKISGPIRDRIDIRRTLTTPSRPELVETLATSRGTHDLAGMVLSARARQRRRYDGTPWRVNADVPGPELRRSWPLTDDARLLLDRQLRADKLNPRSADRVLRLAWSVADLHEHDRPDANDVRTALSLRSDLPLDAAMRALVAA